MAGSDSDERTLSGASSSSHSRASSLDFEDPSWHKINRARREAKSRKRNLRTIGICSAILLVVLALVSHLGTSRSSTLQTQGGSSLGEAWQVYPLDAFTEEQLPEPTKQPEVEEELEAAELPKAGDADKDVDVEEDQGLEDEEPAKDQDGQDDLESENEKDDEDEDDPNDEESKDDENAKYEEDPQADDVEEEEEEEKEEEEEDETKLPEDVKLLRLLHKAPTIKGLPVGNILTNKMPVVADASRTYFLRLDKTGDLKFYRFVESNNKHNVPQLIWSLGSGNIDTKAITNFNAVRLSEDGILSVNQLFQQEKNRKRQTSERLLWHSNLLPECKSPPEQVTALASGDPVFNITPDGKIVIQGRCAIYTPPVKSAGKLALLVSGLFRTNALVCHTHIDYIAKNPGAESVDIFAYVLYEEKDLAGDFTIEDLERSIRDCYGHYLKTLTLKAEADVKEDFPDKVDSNCGRMHRINSQLKTLYLSGLDWWEWSVTKGIRHDTVLRVRTDHEFHGADKPQLKPVNELNGNELVMTPIAGGFPTPLQQHWFCSNPFGSVDVALSDQLAYGTPSAMRYFLMMYQDIRSVIGMSVPANKAYREGWLCLDMPTGPERDQCTHIEYCTVECALSWYLQSWGVQVSIQWDWEFRIKR